MDIQEALAVTPKGFRLTEFSSTVVRYRGEPDILIEYNQGTLNWNMTVLGAQYLDKTLDGLMTQARTVIKAVCTTLEA